MFGSVGQRLGDQEVGGDLDRLGEPSIGPDVQANRNGAAAGECFERRGQAAFDEDGRVDAAGELAQLVQGAGGLGGQSLELRCQLVSLGRHRRFRQLQFQSEGDQPLLGAVMQIALDALPRLVGGGHDPGARGGQLRLALGVGEGGSDELGEAGQPRLGVGGQRVRACGRYGHHAPQPALDVNRHADGRAQAHHAGEVCGFTRGGAVVVDPHRPPGCEHQRGHVVPAEAVLGTDTYRVGGSAAPRAQDCALAVRLVPDHGGEVSVQHPPDLDGDRSEHLLRCRPSATSVATRRSAACSSPKPSTSRDSDSAPRIVRRARAASSPTAYPVTAEATSIASARARITAERLRQAPSGAVAPLTNTRLITNCLGEHRAGPQAGRIDVPSGQEPHVAWYSVRGDSAQTKVDDLSL